MVIWMEVSKDRYELPVVIADSCAELARRCRVNQTSIWKHMFRCRHGLIKRQRFVKVEVEEDE